MIWIAKYFNWRSIYLRFILMIMVPIMILQLVNAYIFFQRHWDNVSEYMNRSVISELSYVFGEVSQGNIEQAGLAAITFNMQLRELDSERYAELKGSYKNDKNLSLLTNYLLLSFADNYTVGFDKVNRNIYVGVLIDGQAYYIEFGRKRIVSPTTGIFIYSMIISSCLIFIISFIFLKNQMRTIVGLARAADTFGRGQQVERIRPSGPLEVRSLAKSFIRMQKRLSRQIKYRTELLAHIAQIMRYMGQ